MVGLFPEDGRLRLGRCQRRAHPFSVTNRCITYHCMTYRCITYRCVPTVRRRLPLCSRGSFPHWSRLNLYITGNLIAWYRNIFGREVDLNDRDVDPNVRGILRNVESCMERR